MRWKKSQATATLRRVLIAAYDSDGAPADARHTFGGTNEKLVDPSTGEFVAPVGTLANVKKPLVVADFTFTTTHGSDLVNKTAHGLSTGDGPFQLTTTTTLPAGYALATDYWWIWLSADTGQWASSLANALAGTAVAITTDGTGTHTASDTATTKRLVDGLWTYTADSSEIAYTGTYFAIRLEHEATTGTGTDHQETAGVVTLTGTGFLPRHVGRRITVAGLTGANNGEFTIASYVSPTAITYANASATDETAALTFTIDDAVQGSATSVDLYVLEHDEIAVGAHTYGDLQRLAMAVLAGPVLDFTTGTLVFKCPVTNTTRLTVTKDATGRLACVLGTLS